MTNSNLTQSIKYPEINLEGTPTIVITKEFQDIVDYLHKKVGSIEWNGFIYSKIEGNIDKPNEMIITPKLFYLGGIGSAAYTEFKTDKAFFDFYMDRTEILEEDLKQGIFHTHLF